MLLPLGLLCGLGLPACSSTPEEDGADVGVVDPDAGRADAARTDAGRTDARPADGGAADGGAADGGIQDSGSSTMAYAWAADIYRDDFGVPSIVGESVADLAFGDGYAQAEDRLGTMVLSYARARGREAERFGPGCMPACLERDRVARIMQSEASAIAALQVFSPQERETMSAFVAGIRKYIDSHPDRVPARLRANPPDIIDVLALGNFAMVGRQFTEAVQDKDGGGWIWDGGAGHGGESNGWSLKEGDQLFVQADPHTPWDNFNWLWEHRWFTTDGRLAATGGVTTGMPGFVHGATDHHAWSFTRTGVDRGDCAVVKVSDDGLQYLRGGVWMDFEVDTQELRIAQASGGPRVEMFPIQRTVDGPVIELKTVEAQRIALVAVLTMKGQASQSLQTIRMAGARTLDGFKNALAMQQIAGFQLFYGDVEGQNFYSWVGRILDRPEDSMTPRRWNQCQPIWEAGTEFGQLRPASGLPRSQTPGVVGDVQFFQGSNAPNFMLTGGDWGLRLADFPSYVHTAVEFDALPARPQRTTDVLVAGGHTSSSMLELSMDSYVLAAEWVRPLLAEAVRAHLANKGTLTPVQRAGLTLLDGWDLVCDRDSRAYTLWRELAAAVADSGVFLSSIRGIYPGLPNDVSEARPAELAALFGHFRAAVASVPRDMSGQVRIWGEINVIDRQTGNVSLGAGGSDTQTMWQGSSKITARDRQGVSHVSGGSNFMMSTRYDLSTQAAEIWSISARGQSEDPASPHYDDQTHIYVERQYKPATVDLVVATSTSFVRSHVRVSAP